MEIIPVEIFHEMMGGSDYPDNPGYLALPYISNIAKPYIGQLGFDSNNRIFMYSAYGTWVPKELPRIINEVGCFKFGNDLTYYLYWIAYSGPCNMQYIVSSRQLNDDSPWNASIIYSTEQKYQFVQSKLSDVGAQYRSFKNLEDAFIEVDLMVEQYKYSCIENLIQKFANQKVEFYGGEYYLL